MNLNNQITKNKKKILKFIIKEKYYFQILISSPQEAISPFLN